MKNSFLADTVDESLLEGIAAHVNDLEKNRTLCYPRAFAVTHEACRSCGGTVSSRPLFSRKLADKTYKSGEALNVWEGASLRVLGCVRCPRTVGPIDAKATLAWNRSSMSYELLNLWPGFDKGYLRYVSSKLRDREREVQEKKMNGGALGGGATTLKRERDDN